MSQSLVDYETSGRIVTVTMNRPETRNAIATQEDCDALVEAVDRANADSDVSVLILTGAGSAFSAGGNIKAMRDRNGIGPLATAVDTRANYRRGVQRIPLAFAESEVAMIAAVNGHAIGLGCDIACLCDMRIASEKASFASSFVKLGIVPGDGGAWILPRAVGYARAAEMILTGDTYTAAQAAEMGLVSRVVAHDRLMEEARGLAERIATNPPRAIRLAKRLLREGQHGRLADVLQLSAAFQALAHETADHHEALDAFFEKRPPRFTGA